MPLHNKGLNQATAEAFGLNVGTAVGTSLIDAHAGGLGLLGCNALKKYEMTERLALITGTSSCQVLGYIAVLVIVKRGVMGLKGALLDGGPKLETFSLSLSSTITISPINPLSSRKFHYAQPGGASLKRND